jgi:hypothetical protein
MRGEKLVQTCKATTDDERIGIKVHHELRKVRSNDPERLEPRRAVAPKEWVAPTLSWMRNNLKRD